MMRLGSKSARSECGERKRQWRVSHAQQCGEGIAPVVRSLLFAGVLGAAITLVGMEGSESSSSMRSPNLQCGEGGNQRVCNGMHCERDPILHSNLAHQLGDVGLDRALPDA